MTISIAGHEVASFEDVPFRDGMNVLQVLEAGHDANPGSERTLRFTVEYFGSELGYELDELDAIGDQIGGDGNHWLFWELRINGELSEKGIESTFPADGDVISWNYTLYEQNQHGESRYRQVRESRLAKPS